MSYRGSCLLILFTLAVRAQTITSDQTYLGLTDAQVQSISSLNDKFQQYTSQRLTQYYQLQTQAQADLSQTSPDPNAVGNDYAQIAMLQRAYASQLAQVQSNVAAVLTPDQVNMVPALLAVERLQPLVSAAQCAYLEQQSTIVSGFVLLGTPSVASTSCQPIPLPTALTLYLNLTDAQITAIESAITSNQERVSREVQRIKDLQNQINSLTAAQTIDAATLGADYVKIQQIQNDESTQTNQLIATNRSLLTDQQQPLLQALDNAMQLSFAATEAVNDNILVLPPDLQSPTCNPLTTQAFPTQSCGGGFIASLTPL